MRKVFSIAFIALFTTCVVSSCSTLTSIPTNTTGGVFSLNGTWRLSSTTDGTSMVGTTITVYPVVANAAVASIGNNTYCVRKKDQLWKNVKANGNGGFTISALVNACNGTPVYNDGTIAVASNQKITVTTRTATNSELVQAWVRIK